MAQTADAHKSKLIIEPLPDRQVRLSISKEEVSMQFEFESSTASYVAAQILRAARESYVQSGAPKHNFMEDWTIWAVASTDALGLGPSQIPNHESMLLQFGDTVMAIPIEKTKLRQLGEALVALSADSTEGH